MSDSDMDLFPGEGGAGRESSPGGGQPGGGDRPLADRYRPLTWDDFAGQDHLVGENGPVTRLVASGRPFSCILWGPPGTGKTTLARLVASSSGARFMEYSAVLSGVKEIRLAVETARMERTRNARATILFVDEIHRFNKSQQDAFLPHMENGTIYLIGATTENPSFEVNAALLSRTRVFSLQPLEEKDLRAILKRALALAHEDVHEGAVSLDEDAQKWLAQFASGDARTLLSLLELALAGAAPAAADGKDDLDASTEVPVTVEDLQQIAGRRTPLHDKGGESHFNLISAMQKSIRGSHADAALYWTARMMEAGEDPLYLFRRLIRIAMEDVGLTVPNALRYTLDCAETYHRLGSPEGDLALAQAVLFLAHAPKSNRVTVAWSAACEAARAHPDGAVPLNLRNAPTRLMKEMGYGRDYSYDHEDPEGGLAQNYFPDGMEGTRFYEPTDQGFESDLRRKRARWEKAREEAKKRAKGNNETSPKREERDPGRRD